MPTKIEWTQETWNPIGGCRKKSAGCEQCYAIRQSHRMAGNPNEKVARRYAGLTQITNGKPNWTGKTSIDEDVLTQPLTRRTPTTYFISLSDLFYDARPDEDIDAVMSVILACAALDGRPHTFQVLTKYAERMASYFSSRTPSELLKAWARRGDGLIFMDNEEVLYSEAIMSATCHNWNSDGANSSKSEYRPWHYTSKLFPLPNLHLGVSVEDQRHADERIPILLQTPAALRFVSYEPALGTINFADIQVNRDLDPKPPEPRDCKCALCATHPKEATQRMRPLNYPRSLNALAGTCITEMGIAYNGQPKLDWVIIGGESGHGARPFDVRWARDTVRQCKAAGVPVFVKQLGCHPQEIAYRLRDKKGGDMSEWPEDLRVRQMPQSRKEGAA